MSEQDKQCREAFEAWWYASKYMQVVFSGESTKQSTFDGWQAAWNSRALQITVTKNESGQIVAVTRTDSEGKILEVIAESAPQTQLTDEGIKQEAITIYGSVHDDDYRFAKAIAAHCGEQQKEKPIFTNVEIEDILTRRVRVENALFACVSEKQPMPDKEQLRKWAIDLGVPTKHRKVELK